MARAGHPALCFRVCSVADGLLGGGGQIAICPYISVPPNFLPGHPFDNGELKIRDEQLAPWPRTRDAVRQHLAAY